MDTALPEGDGIEEIREILQKSNRVRRALAKVCHEKILSAHSGQIVELEDENAITNY